MVSCMTIRKRLFWSNIFMILVKNSKKSAPVNPSKENRSGISPHGCLFSGSIACEKKPAHCRNILPGCRLSAKAASIQFFHSGSKQAGRFRAAPV